MSLSRCSLGDQIFSEYEKVHGALLCRVEDDKWVKLTKTSFAVQCRYDNWGDMTGRIKSETAQDLLSNFSYNPKIKEIALPLLRKLLGQEIKTFKEYLKLCVAFNDLAQADYDDYVSGCINKPNVSIRESFDRILSADPDLSNLEMTKDDAEFISAHFFSKTSFILKLKLINHDTSIIDEMSLNQLCDLFGDLVECLDDNNSEPYWSYMGEHDGVIRKLLAKFIQVEFLSFEDLIDFHRQKNVSTSYRDNALFNGVNMSGFHFRVYCLLWLYSDNQNLSEDDEAALSFFARYCTPEPLNVRQQVSDSSHDALELGMYLQNLESISTKQADRSLKTSFDQLLRNQSSLAAPVMSSYLLYNVSSNFALETIYACLYKLTRFKELSPLIENIERLACVTQNYRYNNEDLESKLVASTVLTVNVKSLMSKFTTDGWKNYVELLQSFVSVGHYDLIVYEMLRTLDFFRLQVVPYALTDVFAIAMARIDYQRLAEFSEIELEGIYLQCHQLDIDTSSIEHLVSDDFKKASQFMCDESVRSLLNDRDEFSRGFQNYEYYAKKCNVVDYDYVYGARLRDALNLMALSLDGEGDDNRNRRNTATNKLIQIPITKKLNDFFSKDANGNELMHRANVFNVHYNHGRNSVYKTIITDADESSLSALGVKLVVRKFLDLQGSSGMYQNFSEARVYKELVALFLHLNLKAADFYESENHAGNEDMVVAYKDDVLYVFNNCTSDELYDVLVKYQPKEIKVFNSRDIQLWPANILSKRDLDGDLRSAKFGVLNWRYNHLNVGHQLTKGDIRLIDGVMMNMPVMGLSRFGDRNPLNEMAIKLAPQFEFLGVRFNTNGTDYFS
ncbi:hypothetical protein I3271_07005 [Photobacterium leiognathi]|uniref:hypothetical protein n=1 Tax=Photobacterium leiognathi TaxID=553611 RepID=UPI001EDF1A2F|nr:hypothetical protein [Photobacterium leiognathi]MCG3884434.1 hypothetical protein [Photobacterium leiognathi]